MQWEKDSCEEKFVFFFQGKCESVDDTIMSIRNMKIYLPRISSNSAIPLKCSVS
jgi:hypothetical protein